MNHFRLATRLYNTPLLITQAKAAEIERVFRAHEEGRAALLSPAPEQPQRIELATPGTVRTDAGYWRTAQGVAIIPVVGTLVQRGDSMDAASGLVGYNRIAGQLQAAVNDPQTSAIMLEIDSNGGEAAGVIDLASKIQSAAKKKPVWTMANEQAFSAGYWLAAAGSKLFVPQTGMVGSVGVVMLHVDQSQRDAKQGLVYTPIFAGDRKVDFSSHAPMSDTAMMVAQEEVDRLYEIFVSAIADMRGVDPQAVRDTQAGLLNPEAAMTLSMVDGVMSFDEALAELSAEAQHVRIYGMRAHSSASPAAVDEAAFPIGDRTMMTEAEKAAQAAAIAEARAAGLAEGKTAATTEATAATATATKAATEAERKRVHAIQTCDAAKGKPSLAAHLALETDMTVEAAQALLAKAAVETPDKPTNALASAMAKVPNPKVGADGQPVADQPRQIKSSAEVIAFRNKQAGLAR